MAIKAGGGSRTQQRHASVHGQSQICVWLLSDEPDGLTVLKKNDSDITEDLLDYLELRVEYQTQLQMNYTQSVKERQEVCQDTGDIFVWLDWN